MMFTGAVTGVVLGASYLAVSTQAPFELRKLNQQINGGWYSFKYVKYAGKVFTPFALGGAAVYFTYETIMRILRPHGHSNGRPQLVDDMFALGLIGGALSFSYLGLYFVP